MSKLWAKLRFKKRDKCENKCLPFNAIPDEDFDKEYVLKEDKPLTDDCKRLSISLSVLYDSGKEYIKDNSEKQRIGSSVNIFAIETKTDDNKQNSTSFGSSKPKSDSGVKRNLFSRLKFRSENKTQTEQSSSSSAPISNPEQDLHVIWYTDNSSDLDESTSKVSLRHSWLENERHKELANSIAQELKSKTHSLFVPNDNKISFLRDDYQTHRF